MNRRDLFTLAGKVGLVALPQQVPWSWLERAGLLDEYFAEAAALPQNYLVQTGSVLCDTSLGLSGIVGHQVHDGTATWLYQKSPTLPIFVRQERARLSALKSRRRHRQVTQRIGLIF